MNWVQGLVVAGGFALAGCVSAVGVDRNAAESGPGYAVLKSLTTEVGARLAGSRKEAQAREWAVAKLASLGFVNVHEEPFAFHGWERGTGSAEVVGPVRIPLVMAALGGSVSTPAGGITARVAFVDSYDDLLKAAPGSFKGRIVYVNDHMVRARDGSGYGPAVRKRSKGAIEAARRGAIAVVIRSAGTDSNRFAHTGNLRYEAGVRQIPGIALSGPDADQIERLHATGRDITLKLELRTRDVPHTVSGNVVADIVGREYPDEIILLGAHLDSWDLGTGAIDDGAGVGIIVGAALRAAGPDMKPKRTIRVVLFGAEEYTGGGNGAGTGGEAYAKSHAAEIANHIVATEADFGAGAPWRYDTNVPASDLAFYEQIFDDLRPLGIERGKSQTDGGTDIEPLHKAGVRIISIAQDGTNYFDLHHTANDTLDKVDPVTFELNVEAYARAVSMVANQ
ncbi:MAG: M28 family peptidase [Micropepsaceae bacterium]